MKYVITVLLISISLSAIAKDKPKSKPAVKVQEDKPRVDPVPGGASGKFQDSCRV